jgi:hypothetical protein
MEFESVSVDLFAIAASSRILLLAEYKVPVLQLDPPIAIQHTTFL